MKGIPILFLLLTISLTAGCGDGQETDYYRAVLWPSTHQIDESGVSQIISVDQDGTFLFVKSSAIAAELAPGHVLLAGETSLTPRGALRRVVSITETSDGIQVATEQAMLQHAFKSLHTRFTRQAVVTADDIIWDVAPGARLLDSTESRPTPTGMTRRLSQSPVPDAPALVPRESGSHQFGPLSLDYYPFNGDNDDSSWEDQIHVTATFGGSIEYQFGIDFDWPDLDDVLGGDPIPEITVGFYVGAQADAAIDVEGMAKYSFERKDTLGHAYLGSFWIGPLFFTVNADLLSILEGGASSRFIMHTGAGASFETGAQYSTDDGGKLTPPTFDSYFDPPEVTSTESAYLKASIGPRLRLALYDIFGPHVTVYAFAELAANSDADPCWDLRAGVYGDIGIDLTIWGETIAEWSEEFDIWDTSIVNGQCVPDPNAPPVPDLIDPTFTPWSIRLADTAGAWDLDRDFMTIEPLVDGHWLVSGSGAKALSKVTSDGRVLWSRRYVRPEATLPIPQPVNRAVQARDLGLMAAMSDPVMLARLDADGGVMRAWRLDLQNQPVVGIQAILPAGDGTFYVGAPFNPTDGGPSDAMVFRVDDDGNVLWARRWGRETLTEWVTSIVFVEDDIVVIGQSFGLDQDPAGQSWAMRLGPDGSTKWVRTIRGLGDTEAVRLRRAHTSMNGDVIAGGSYGLGGPDVMLVKIKPDGSLGWVSGNFGGDLGLDMTDFFQLSDGGYLMAGTWWTGGTDSMWVARTDSVGTISWLHKFADGVEDGSPSIVLTGEGGAMMAGYTERGVDHNSAWITRFPVKTGTLTLDPAAASITSEPVREASSLELEFADATVLPTELNLVLIPETLVSTPAMPTIDRIDM